MSAGFPTLSKWTCCQADAYFYQSTNLDGSIDRSNEKLDVTKSQHYVLGYEILPIKNWRIKADAYFLMDKKDMNPSDVYLEVGFEDLSHFSFAFKKQFGFPPTKLKEQKGKSAHI